MYAGRCVAAVVLARSGSRRLPGKMLLPFGGSASGLSGRSTVLSSVLERLRAAETVDQVVLATTTAFADDALAEAAQALGVRVVRGSENDVVGRMQQAVRELESESVAPAIVVRACADNPLVMPTVVDAGVRELAESGADLITPFEYATLPFGYGLVALTRSCLGRIDAEAVDATYREHVENFCFEHPERFDVRYQVADDGLAWPELCLTLDYAVDYERLVRCERLLRGVPLKHQPRMLIETLSAQSVWVEGVSPGDAAGHDLILAVRAPRGCGQPASGFVVVDTCELGGAPRFVLRYADEEQPLFVDRRALRAGDTAHAFLAYAAPLVVQALRAAPARPVDLAAWAAEKEVRAGARRGFRTPDDAAFPRGIALLPGAETGPAFERVAPELERHPDAQLFVAPGEPGDAPADAIEALRSLFGAERVRTMPSVGCDAFALVQVGADGVLSAGGTRAEREMTIEEFWRSPELQRARALELNGAAA